MAELLAEDGLFRLIGLGFLHAVQHDSVIMHRLVATFTLTQDERRTADARTAVENCLPICYAKPSYAGGWRCCPSPPVTFRRCFRPGLARGTLSAAWLATWWGAPHPHLCQCRRYLTYSVRWQS